jgi:hypothetical protein
VTGPGPTDPAGPGDRRSRWILLAVFLALLAAFSVGLWGTVDRPPAYEVRGTVVARAAPGLLLVRHEAVTGLGMGAMELMAVTADPALLDAADVRPGEAVRLAVRPRGDEVVLLRIDRVR